LGLGHIGNAIPSKKGKSAKIFSLKLMRLNVCCYGVTIARFYGLFQCSGSLFLLDDPIPLSFRDTPASKAAPMIEAFARDVQNILGEQGYLINDRLLKLLMAARDALRMDDVCITQIKRRRVRVLCATPSDTWPQSVALNDIDMYTMGQIIRQQTMVASEAVNATPITKTVDLTGRSPGRYIGAPILFDGKAWGTVEMSGTAQPDGFSPDEITAAVFLAAVLSVPLALLS
jgi:GAF domain-containing protein